MNEAKGNLIYYNKYHTMRAYNLFEIYSSSGATNSEAREARFSVNFSFAAARFSDFFFNSRCFSLIKYSPDSICKSTLLGVGAGGKGVYAFAARNLCGTLRFEVFFFLKLGKKRDQSSVARLGSYRRDIYINDVTNEGKGREKRGKTRGKEKEKGYLGQFFLNHQSLNMINRMNIIHTIYNNLTN